ncbi:hypothetical protein IWQ62_003425 [Dispira parvispora]|uniref:Uncharacterized protein n=1 Tax=Dispira parvispora TaxID=1520584 RepID=A0A9W8AUV1_9FUNG|nr:hypothetical protein IWQ62_003425 [Dispira parvispora]
MSQPSSTHALPKVTHLIFDMDGLLLDTERIYTQVSEKILEPHGCKFTWEVKAKMMGRTTKDTIRVLLEETGAPLTEQEYFEQSNAMQVGTSSRKEIFDVKTSQNQPLFQHFNSITCGDDPNVKLGKPHPDIFIEACRRLGNPSPEQCLVFEDSLLGVEAAKRAGMHVVWIPDSNILKLGHPDDHGACEILNSMEEFDPAKYGLPGFEA